MAILDKILKQKKEEKKEEKREKEEKKEKPSEKIVASKKEKAGSRKEEKKYPFAYRVLREPHITEKSTMLNERNEYVFKVYPKANKTEIKKAIESLYNIDVLDVRIINIHQKSRRLGRTTGFKKGYKKAIVKIKEGQKIEVLPR